MAFRHALLREAAVAVAPPSHARAAHRAWAGRLERRDRDLPVAVAVARHWTAGDRPGPALHAWLHAAVLAEQVSAYPEQTRMLTEAAALWSGVPPGEHPPDMDLAYVLTRAAEAATLGLGRPDLSQRLLADGARCTACDAPAARRAWLTILWDRSLRHRDDHLTWHEAMETAGDIPPTCPVAERAVACLWASGICQRAAHLDEAHTLASEAVLVSEASETSTGGPRRSALAVPSSPLRGDDATGRRDRSRRPPGWPTETATSTPASTRTCCRSRSCCGPPAETSRAWR